MFVSCKTYLPVCITCFAFVDPVEESAIDVPIENGSGDLIFCD